MKFPTRQQPPTTTPVATAEQPPTVATADSSPAATAETVDNAATPASTPGTTANAPPAAKPLRYNQKLPAIDPSQPLTNPRFELMAQLRVKGSTQQEAYQATAGKRVKANSAKQGASVIFSRGDVAARVAWLTIDARANAQNGEKSDKLPSAAPSQPPKIAKNDTSPPSRDALEAIIWQNLTNAPTSAEVASLTNALLKVAPQLAATPDDGTRKPDPAAVVAYVCQFAGMSSAELIQELGGERLLVQRICQALKIDAIKLRDMAQAYV